MTGPDSATTDTAVVDGKYARSVSPAGFNGPTRPLSPAGIFWYVLANIGFGMFFSLNNATLPLFLKQYTQDNRLIGLLGSTHSFEGAIIQPIIGTLSDRLRTRLGRRRPFLLIFTPLSALFLLLTPAATHLPLHTRLIAIVACIFLFTVFFNMAQDPYQALLADITPEPQRGRVTGFWMLSVVIGQAALVLLPLPLVTKFSLAAVVMLVTTFLTCWRTPEPAHPVETHQVTGFRTITQALSGLKTLQQAGKAIGALFCSGLGIGAILPFLTLFVKQIAHATDHEAEQQFLILMLSTAIGVLPAGWLTDRIGPKRVLFLGLALIGVAALNGLWITNLTQISIVMALAGLGNAAQSAAAYPLLTSLVPAEEVGFYTGLQSTALSIATPLTTFVTGALVNGGSYRVIFMVCAVCLGASLLVLAAVQTHAAKAEIAVRDREQGRAA